MGMCIGKQWVIKLNRLFQRVLEKVLTLCREGWTVELGIHFVQRSRVISAFM